MLRHLKLTNIGPADTELAFGKRLNLITGDNGLGKSFLLDIAWWAMTRTWPAEVNPNLTAGRMALPTNKRTKAELAFSFTGVTRTKDSAIAFDSERQTWTIAPGRPANPGLVFYAMADGSFAVWDPARNYWKASADELRERPPAYVFSPAEVWDGLQKEKGKWLCNGLLRDWASWQRERGRAFDTLTAVLAALSPSDSEVITPGDLTRISLDDVRDMPTLRMPYGQEVAVVHASSGMRRIISLAYFLVWCWEEHLKAKDLVGGEPDSKATFLIDEVESHLHPKWQRTVIPALMQVMSKLQATAEVQLIAVTHSPLIMASVEPLFDAKQDVWFDLDLVDGKVILAQREFERHGDAGTWLVTEAFDLTSGRSVQYERLIAKAEDLLEGDAPDLAAIKDVNAQLVAALNPQDEYLSRWRYICSKKGWLP